MAGDILPAGIFERLTNRWHFVSSECNRSDVEGEMRTVDVGQTNTHLVLSGRSLGDFFALPATHPQVPNLDALSTSSPLTPRDLGVVMLCGGLGTRSGGAIHPLRRVSIPGTADTRTLIDLRLHHFAQSPLREATLLLMASSLNRGLLDQHFRQAGPIGTRPHIFSGAVVPRLDRKQPVTGAPMVWRDSAGHPLFNPAGHFDALRWLVGSGCFEDVIEKRIILTTSYSNVGQVFGSDTLRIAGCLSDKSARDSDWWFLVEVASRPVSKRTGALLVVSRDEPDRLQLVKYGYGEGDPQLPTSDRLLMSTNTLYFSIPAIEQRLIAAANALDCRRGGTRDSLRKLLRLTKQGESPLELLRIFDMAFPVDPVLSCKAVAGIEMLQAERDLDQLSLLPWGNGLLAVEVPYARGISIKQVDDLQDREKRPYLFGEGLESTSF